MNIKALETINQLKAEEIEHIQKELEKAKKKDTDHLKIIFQTIKSLIESDYELVKKIFLKDLSKSLEIPKENIEIKSVEAKEYQSFTSSGKVTSYCIIVDCSHQGNDGNKNNISTTYDVAGIHYIDFNIE